MRAEPKILQIVADGSPGGGTTVVLGLCEDLMSQGGWQVSLVSAAGSYALQQAQALGLPHEGLSFAGRRLDLQRLKALYRVLRHGQPDVVHIHGARAGLPVALLLMLRRPGLRLVYTVHGLHFTLKPWPARWLGALAERLIARVADATVYVSAGDLRQARGQHIAPPSSRETRVVFNGIAPADFERPQAARPPVDLVFVGRLVRQKNPLFLVDLMRHLRPHGISLAVVGGGDLQDVLRQELQREGLTGAVTLHGALSRDATIHVMRSAQLLIFPSLWEGLPVTPIEASWLELPVLASKISGTDEVVQDGVNGVLIEGFDAGDYARHVLRLLGDPAELVRLGRNGRLLVERQFLRQRCSDGYRQLYAELLAPGTESLMAPGRP